MPTIISGGFVLAASPCKPRIDFTVVYRCRSGRMAAAPARDIEIPQSDDVQVLISVVDEAGIAVDLSNLSEARFIIASGVTSNAALISKTRSGGTLSLGTNSQLFFTLRTAETGALPAARLYHELRLTNSDGWHQTVQAGQFIIQDTFIGD